MRSGGSDPAFLDWLRRRHPGLCPREVRRDVEALREAGLLDAAPEDLERELRAEGRDDATVERLLLLQGAARAFERSAPADPGVAWIGEESPAVADDGPTWVESGPMGAPAATPTGAPPPLVPRSRRRRPTAPPRTRLRLLDLLLPAVVLAALAAAGAAAAWSEVMVHRVAERGRAVAREAREPLREAAWLHAELRRRAAAVQEGREAQGEALARACEGGPWCRARRAAVDAAVQEADGLARLLADTDTVASAEPPPSDARSGAPLAGVVAALRREAGELRRRAEERPGEPGSAAAVEHQRLERRAEVLSTEASALEQGVARALERFPTPTASDETSP